MAEFANDSIDGLKKLLKLIDKLKKELKEGAIAAKELTENITPSKARAKEIEELTKQQELLVISQRELATLEKQELKLKAKLVLTEAGLTDEVTKLKVQTQELNKEKKEEAKEALGLIDAYQKQSKRLNKLRKEYKALIIAEGKTTKATKKLLKQITRLDKELKDVDASAGQFNRVVGNYPKTLSDATKGLLGFAAAAGGTALSLQGINDALTESQEGSKEVRTLTNRLSAGFTVLKNTAAQATLGLIDLGKVVLSGNFGRGGGSLFAAVNRIASSVENFGERIDKVIENADKLTDKTTDFEKRIRILNLALAEVNAELELQNQIAGDNTLSLEQNEEAIRRVALANRGRAKLLREVAKTELEIVNAQIAATENGEENIALLDKQNEALVRLRDTEAELAAARQETEKVTRDILQERFETELDFAIDAFDAQKTLNERRLGDERNSLDERKKIAIETTKLAEQSFQSQIDLLTNFTKQEIDIRALAEEEDEKLIREELNRFDLSVITRTRILEIIRERKMLIGDLIDIEKELTAEIEERAQAEIDAANELTQFRLELKAARSETLNDEIESAEFRAGVLLDSDKILADERTLIEEQLQQELADIRKKFADKEAQARKEQAKQIIDLARQISSELRLNLSNRNQFVIDDLDSQIDARRAGIDQQRGLAERGADNQLAFEKEELTHLLRLHPIIVQAYLQWLS